MQISDILVIGGAIGTATAFELAKRGKFMRLL